MRLICPNCDAQYEVDDAAIPPAGRDVQCSSCGHAWFQMHPDIWADLQPEAAAPADLTGPEEPATIWSDPDVDRPDGPADIDALNIDALNIDGPPPLPSDLQEEAGPRRRSLDDTVLAVLREEAEREAAVRRTETPPPMEVHMDPGLALPPPPPLPPSVLAARERFADLSVSPDDLASEDDMAVRAASRRDLLPDIEQINSTLRAGSVPRGDAAEADTETYYEEDRRGFRSGFVLILVIAALLWSAYALAPRFISAVPASEAAVLAYVGAVDRARLGVDAALQSASRSLRNLVGLGGEAG
jgi:predicted Zn finger-like uncharacterized protein